MAGVALGLIGDGCGTADGSGEVGVATYEHFACGNPLTAAVLERMLAGVSTRQPAQALRAKARQVGERTLAARREVIGFRFAQPLARCRPGCSATSARPARGVGLRTA